eukprot:gene24428-13745_t
MSVIRCLCITVPTPCTTPYREPKPVTCSHLFFKFQSSENVKSEEQFMSQLRTEAFQEGTDVMTGRPVKKAVEPAFIPTAFPSRHSRGNGPANGAAATASTAAAASSPSRLGSRASTGGAYQYTSFVQKIKKWQTVAETLTQRIDKTPELREEHSDPAVAEQLLNESWGQLRVHLDAMANAAGGILEVTTKPGGKTSKTSARSIDFGTVEIQTLKMLKGMKPAINAVRVAAVLEDTPGMSGSLLRRMKTMCGGIQRLIAGLSTRELSAPETQTELRAAVKEMQTPINQILKHASKGV